VKKLKSLFLIQLLTAGFGSIFAYTSVYFDFQRFYLVEGTYTKIKDCVIPNPVTTPCFWGAFGFLATTIWAFFIYKKYFIIDKSKAKGQSNKDKNTPLKKDYGNYGDNLRMLEFTKIKQQQKYFSAFALFGTAFAWANMANEFIKYFNAGGTSYTGCGGATVANPFLTACFGGSVIFFSLFIVSIFTFIKLKKYNG